MGENLLGSWRGTEVRSAFGFKIRVRIRFDADGRIVAVPDIFEGSGWLRKIATIYDVSFSARWNLLQDGKLKVDAFRIHTLPTRALGKLLPVRWSEAAGALLDAVTQLMPAERSESTLSFSGRDVLHWGSYKYVRE
jgi:hypothetical protein